MKAFIIFRDRVTYARQCRDALLKAGLDVHVVDHGSTWPEALHWLGGLEAVGEPVMRRGENAYPWQLWSWGPFRDLMERDPHPYIVTDPDVTPAPFCPPDWPGWLMAVLAGSDAVKVGLGLRTGNLPDDDQGKLIASLEAGYWVHEHSPQVFHANVDTTLAVYRPFPEYPVFSLYPGLRTGYPYVADHFGWHEREPLSEELAYYKAHADPGHQFVRHVR